MKKTLSIVLSALMIAAMVVAMVVAIGAAETTGINADMLDVTFDVEGENKYVDAAAGQSIVTYYDKNGNETEKQSASKAVVCVNGKYYEVDAFVKQETTYEGIRFDFTKGGELTGAEVMAKWADGYTLEVAYQPKFVNTKDGAQVKNDHNEGIFSGTQGGGIGIYLRNEHNGDHSVHPNFMLSHKDATSYKNLGSGVTAPAGELTVCTVTYNKEAGKVYIYINGVLKNELAATDPVLGGSYGKITMGADIGSNQKPWDNRSEVGGIFYSAKVSSEVATAEQIKASYDKTIADITKGTEMYKVDWKVGDKVVASAYYAKDANLEVYAPTIEDLPASTETKGYLFEKWNEELPAKVTASATYTAKLTEVTRYKADMLDLSFNAAAGATEHKFVDKAGQSTIVYYDKDGNALDMTKVESSTATKTAVFFNGKYYEVDAYMKAESDKEGIMVDFKKLPDGTAVDKATGWAKWADGYTIELMYQPKVVKSVSAEQLEANNMKAHNTGVFSGTQGGGFGIYLRNENMNKALPNAGFMLSHKDASSYKNVNTMKAANAGELYHIVATYDKTAGKVFVYLNGELVNEQAASDPALGSAPNAFTIGADADAAGAPTADKAPIGGAYYYVKMSADSVTADQAKVAYNEAYTKITSSKEVYVINFLNPDGTEISSKYYAPNATIEIPEFDATKVPEGETYVGWSQAVSEKAVASATYTALVGKKLAPDMLDLSFDADGTVKYKDSIGKSTITYYDKAGAVTTTTSAQEVIVNHNGKYYRVDAFVKQEDKKEGITIDFTKGGTVDKNTVWATIADGYTLEVMYQPKTINLKDTYVKNDQNEGIFSGTQGGGTGIYLRNENLGDHSVAPNFMLSHKDSASYKNLGALQTPAMDELYHVVATYDKTAGKVYIYVNGYLANEVAAGDPTLAGQSAGAIFSLGADTSGSGTPGDNPSEVGGIFYGAKIYSETATPAQVKIAYDEMLAGLAASEVFKVEWVIDTFTKTEYYAKDAELKVPEFTAEELPECTEDQIVAIEKWSPTLPATVTESATYTADWRKVAATYEITFEVDGVKTKVVTKYGEIPVFEGTPTKAEDDTYTYTFKGWDKELAPATRKTTYEAVFEATLKPGATEAPSGTNAPSGDGTNAPAGDGTNAPAGDATDAPATDAPKTEGGCKSAIGTASIAVVMLGAVAGAALLKKKED